MGCEGLQRWTLHDTLQVAGVLGGGWNSVARRCRLQECWEGGGTVYPDVEAVDSEEELRVQEGVGRGWEGVGGGCRSVKTVN